MSQHSGPAPNNSPLIVSVNGIRPVWGKHCFIAPNATLSGDVIMGEGCTVWFQAVVRGDVHSIRIGDRTNIQDGAIVHCTYRKAATQIGSEVSIGHRAIVHGCTIEDNALIGMGAIVMDHAVVESGCIVAAGALVLENFRCESGHIYAGIPAKAIKKVSPEQLLVMHQTALRYIEYSKWMDNLEGTPRPYGH
jgi:carbonic anhydrase/acetyltransferase-like protein (isoleucine patch superfamily)